MKHIQNLDKLKKQKEGVESEQKSSLSTIATLLKTLDELGGRIRSSSKEAINASVNEDLVKAEKLLRRVTLEIKDFNKKLSASRGILGKTLSDSRLKTSDLQSVYNQLEVLEKDFLGAREEYYESKILFSYLKSDGSKILSSKDLILSDFETYAGALGDFCGELLRKAKVDIIKKRNTNGIIKKYYQDTQYIYQVLANFSFSNKSGIRTKVDNLKGYISSFENVLYDLSVRRK